MVSFQCEGCGDVQTKKKLDAHRNHCRAPFTCIDCMTTFKGTEYRAHTSCMTEDQKYQGHLYRDKQAKNAKRKTVSIIEPTDQKTPAPRKAYVEDEPEVEIPPKVPTPPPAVQLKLEASVFDYLVDDSEANGVPQITFSDKRDREESRKEERHEDHEEDHEEDLDDDREEDQDDDREDDEDQDQETEMSMKNGALSVFSRPMSRNEYRNNEERAASTEYEVHGFSYGTEPVNPRPLDMNGSTLTLDFMTPAAKVTKAKLDRKEWPGSVSHSRTNSGAGSEKKRKRGQADELSGTDSAMLDAPETIRRSIVDTPAVVHTGLTGGLSRMMTSVEDFPFARSPSSEPEHNLNRDRPVRRSTKHEDPASPLKKTRRSKEDANGLGISLKGRAGKVLSMVGGALTDPNGHTTITDGALIRTRRRTSSSENLPKNKDVEKRERKKHKVTRHNGTSPANVRIEHKPKRPEIDETFDTRRKVKTIEYHKEYSNSDSDDENRRGGDQQMVVFGEEERMMAMCSDFLSYVNKGPRSERGYSINKVLKRWHRDREVHGASKLDEEKDLWRGLRLKKNDRGEIVLFF